ncbi:hypothetical protein CBR_g81568 [Chara braunii]|uniref:Reverse transcriptase domain-containing protein n=1 Tax=Chara braunii TaxID=69332 RepID=A0A388KB18_CHABU|nr:hypothetical protein CBR_g81568 [Chara braunii]|eukprot:GBG67143.1 hypothetical protein CBR_g81568 [Chara braunii]
MTIEFRAMLDRFVLVYLDDILVYSRTLEEHLEHLRRVLETLRSARYKANRDKCEFVRQELEYLGHFVSPEGIRPLTDKIQAIQEWPEPKNVTDVRSFLGLAGYYQRFIKSYSKIAANLSKLQSEERPFDFDDDARHSFETLKAALLSAEVLHTYDPLLATRVTTNASGYGIGAVLEQHDGTDWHSVEYFSKKVPPVHSIDDARKKELLAFVHALNVIGEKVKLVNESHPTGNGIVNPGMDQKSEETDEAYQARMLLLITEAKQWSDAVAAATKKKAEDAEKARLLAIEQQCQHDEAATKAADEERLQRREKIFSAERALLAMAADWQAEAEAENGKTEQSENKIALLLSHHTDLPATCIAQQEDIHNLDDSVRMHNQVFDQVNSRLQQLEQTVVAPVASSSNTSDHLEALEIEIRSLKDGVSPTSSSHLPDRPISHEIILEAGAVPPKGCIYRMSEEELTALRAQLDDLLDKGWIRPSSSPYGAPILFVRKKNKDLRLCIDYRKLNMQTVKNAGPLPRIDDLLERLGGTKYFSKLDLKSGYHQISIQPNDRYKSAFKTQWHFEWVVMPFGLTNAPMTFQAAMTNEFHAMLDWFMLVYLDDILVYSRTLEDHLGHLRRVLETLRRAKYKANRDKCEFVRQKLEYLGHFVTSQGISPLSEKIQAIQERPEPRNVTDVRSFLSLVGYYPCFIKGYSKIAAQLTKLQCEDRLFDFGEDAKGSDCHGHYRAVPQAQDRCGWDFHGGRATHQSQQYCTVPHATQQDLPPRDLSQRQYLAILGITIIKR